MEFMSRDPQQVAQMLNDASDFPALEDVPFELWYVTEMRNFHFDDEFLNQISEKLEEELESKISSVKRLQVKMSVIRQPPSLPVVELIVFNGKDNFFVNAYFLSVRNVSLDLPTVLFPFLCVFVNKIGKLTRTVADFLERSFSCLIEPVCINDFHFRTLLAISTHETLRRGDSEGVTISTRVMVNKEKAALVHMTMDADGLNTMWSLEPEENKIRGKDVTEFSDLLFDHFDEAYGMKVSNLPMERFVLSGVNIHLDKRLEIRIADMGVLLIILKYLQQESERVKLYNPSKPIPKGNKKIVLANPKRKRPARHNSSESEM